VPIVTESAITLEFFRPDGFSLEVPVEWGGLGATREQRWAALRMTLRRRRLRRAMSTLPLNRADVVAIGGCSAYIQDILAFDAGAPRWDGIDHSARVAEVAVPVSSIGGWYDIFLPGQLR